MASITNAAMRNYQVAFGVTGVAAVGGAGWLFRDLADLSQW
jgi:hypothetical protein